MSHFEMKLFSKSLMKFWNGFFYIALRLQLANSKMWAFQNQNFCIRIEIFELQKVNSKFAQFINDFYSFQNEVFEMFLFIMSHFEIR